MSEKIVAKIRTAAETTLQGAGCLLLLTACIGLFIGTLCYFTGDHIDRADMSNAFATAFSSEQKPASRTLASKLPAVKKVISPAAVIVTPTTAHAVAPSAPQIEEHSEEIAANAPRESAHPRN